MQGAARHPGTYPFAMEVKDLPAASIDRVAEFLSQTPQCARLLVLRPTTETNCVAFVFTKNLMPAAAAALEVSKARLHDFLSALHPGTPANLKANS